MGDHADGTGDATEAEDDLQDRDRGVVGQGLQHFHHEKGHGPGAQDRATDPHRLAMGPHDEEQTNRAGEGGQVQDGGRHSVLSPFRVTWSWVDR